MFRLFIDKSQFNLQYVVYSFVDIFRKEIIQMWLLVSILLINDYGYGASDADG